MNKLVENTPNKQISDQNRALMNVNKANQTADIFLNHLVSIGVISQTTLNKLNKKYENFRNN